MSESVKRVPQGFHTVTPHLTVRGGAEMIEFYKKAFGAKELRRSVAPDGKLLLHAELQIGDSRVLLNDEFPQMGAKSPLELNFSPVTIHLFVEDVDSLYQQAIDAGAKVVMPLADQFWGDRYGIIQDPSGHHWSLASHIRDLNPQQLKEASDAILGGKPKGECH
jgi:PhnB protein